MESTRPKPFVFVLMPFAAEFDDIYNLGIKPACEEAGGYCERVDEQIFETSILERIYNQINKADLIIADMSGRNANVFYEVGYAHGLERRVILVTQESDDIPFDLKHYPHVVYSGRISTLKDELLRRVSFHLSQERSPSTRVEAHRVLEFHIYGQQIIEGATIKLQSSSIRRLADQGTEIGLGIWLSVGIRNPTNSIVESDFEFSFIFPPDTHMEPGSAREFEEVVQSDSRRLVLSTARRQEYLPLFETSKSFLMIVPSTALVSGFELPVTLRFYLRHGVEDIEFWLSALDAVRKGVPNVGSSTIERG